jgi:PhnB protein
MTVMERWSGRSPLLLILQFLLITRDNEKSGAPLMRAPVPAARFRSSGTIPKGGIMAGIKVNPYINFRGTAEKAIRLYETALGAKTGPISRYGDAPQMGAKPEDRNLVMHASLEIGGGLIMISDTPPERPTPTDSNVQISLQYDDAAAMEKAFNALAAGGTITMPLGDMFWGAKFGMLTDAFGIHWMFNCEHKKS